MSEENSESNKLKIIKIQAKKAAKLELAIQERKSKDDLEDELSLSMLKLAELKKKSPLSDFDLEKLEMYPILIEGLKKLISNSENESLKSSKSISGSSDSTPSTSSVVNNLGTSEKKETNEEINEERNEIKGDIQEKKQDAVNKENNSFEKKKEKAKSNYQKKVNKINEGPPSYLSFFANPAMYWLLAILASILILVSSSGLIRFLGDALAFAFYLTAALLSMNFGVLIFAVIVYGVDLALLPIFVLIGSFVPNSFSGLIIAGLAILPELFFWKIGIAPYKILANAIGLDKDGEKTIGPYQLQRLRDAEDNYTFKMHILQKNHDERLDEINKKYDGEKLSLFSRIGTKFGSLANNDTGGYTLGFLVVILGIILTFTNVIGLPYPEFNPLKLTSTVIFFILIFFMQKAGLVPNG